MHRRKSSISSKGDDCFLDSIGNQGQQPQVVPNGNQGQRPPQVIFVSALGELQSALIERDARIAFLEKELVDTRLQLALAKTSEDRLVMELNKANKMSLELAEATKRNSSICFVSEDDSGSSDRSARLSSLTEPPAVATLPPRPVYRTLTNSRKRTVDEDADPFNSLWHKTPNPTSSSSGRRLLEGDKASGGISATVPTTRRLSNTNAISTRRLSNGVNNTIMWAPARNSATSINRHLGDMGISLYSEDSLKTCKFGAHKVQVQKNEEWDIAPPRYQPFSLGRNNPTTASSAECNVINHRNKQTFLKLNQELDLPAASSESKIMSYWKPMGVKHNRNTSASTILATK